MHLGVTRLLGTALFPGSAPVSCCASLCQLCQGYILNMPPTDNCSSPPQRVLKSVADFKQTGEMQHRLMSMVSLLLSSNREPTAGPDVYSPLRWVHWPVPCTQTRAQHASEKSAIGCLPCILTGRNQWSLTLCSMEYLKNCFLRERMKGYLRQNAQSSCMCVCVCASLSSALCPALDDSGI